MKCYFTNIQQDSFGAHPPTYAYLSTLRRIALTIALILTSLRTWKKIYHLCFTPTSNCLLKPNIWIIKSSKSTVLNFWKSNNLKKFSLFIINTLVDNVSPCFHQFSSICSISSAQILNPKNRLCSRSKVSMINDNYVAQKGNE